jgi:U3 small nucleolar RNA-associated protein 21
MLISIYSFYNIVVHPPDHGNHLKEMGPSAIDMEVGLLGPDAGGSLDLCAAFLNFSLNILMSRRDFELINAYLGVFLAKNGESLIKESRLVELVQEIREKDKSVWNDVQHQLHQCLCVAKFLRSATL